MRATEDQTAQEAAELLMEHGTQGAALIRFKARDVESAAAAVHYLAHFAERSLRNIRIGAARAAQAADTNQT